MGGVARRVEVTDVDDPLLADYRELRDVALRRRLEIEHGLFLAEGEKVLRRAVAAGYPVRSFLLAPRWLPSLADVLDASDAPCFVAADDVVEQVTGFHVHRGALAALQRRPLPAVTDVIAGAHRLAVLEDLVDHTNVGAIVRCAAALGVDGMVLSPRCADPLYRRAIKVSMGAVFSVPYARMGDRRSGLAELRSAGFTLLALTPAADAQPLDELDPAVTAAGTRLAVLLGTEGDGLSARWQDAADLRVRIPMGGGVESLNVAAAAAVAFYALRP
jgi:tRNA G18 (ribose-2'-O)-methylase SpoU